MNPAEPLPDAQHERFACELAKGAGVNEAYVAAGYKSSPASATRLSKKVNVAERVAWLQKQAAKGDVLTIREKREFLARVVRKTPSEAAFDDADCQLVMTKLGPAVVIPDKLAAIRIDNDLAEEGSEAKGIGALALLLGRVRR